MMSAEVEEALEYRFAQEKQVQVMTDHFEGIAGF
jgi:hypothetical protein